MEIGNTYRMKPETTIETFVDMLFAEPLYTDVEGYTEIYEDYRNNPLTITGGSSIYKVATPSWRAFGFSKHDIETMLYLVSEGE